ncbi:hypothetical protein ACV229_30865 [Burkholderia sp. MR1-5-21]
MNVTEKSLHCLVEKWLAPGPRGHIRVLRFGHLHGDARRYAHVEASTSAGPRAIFFFRHDDGGWCVFPPCIERPSMTVHRLWA